MNEFLIKNGLIVSGSTNISGSVTATNNITAYQVGTTLGSVLGGRYFSSALISAGTVTYGSYSTNNVSNLDIYANNENIGNGALLRLSSRFGGDSGAYLASSQTGNVVLAVNGINTYNYGLVLNGSTMNVGIGGSNPSNSTARLHIIGSGTTSATTALLVQNANASSSLVVQDNGFVGINTGSAAYNLDVNGTARISGNTTIYQSNLFMDSSGDPSIIGRNASGTESTKIVIRSQTHGGLEIGTIFGGGYLAFQAGNGVYTERMRITNVGFIGIGTTTPSSSLHVVGNTILSGSFSTSSAALTVYKSGSTTLDIQGSQGQLFSIVDSLSGSLMSVNDVSGLPILEVFSNDTVVMGTYGTPAVIITGSTMNVTGSLVTQGQVLDPAFIWFMS